VECSREPPAEQRPRGEELLVAHGERVGDGVLDGVGERGDEYGRVPEDHVDRVGRVAPRRVVVVHLLKSENRVNPIDLSICV